MERFLIYWRKILGDSSEVISEVAWNKAGGITLEESALKRIASGMDITMVYPIEEPVRLPTEVFDSEWTT